VTAHGHYQFRILFFQSLDLAQAEADRTGGAHIVPHLAM